MVDNLKIATYEPPLGGWHLVLNTLLFACHAMVIRLQFMR
jgi:hypothetical protein